MFILCKDEMNKNLLHQKLKIIYKKINWGLVYLFINKTLPAQIFNYFCALFTIIQLK